VVKTDIMGAKMAPILLDGISGRYQMGCMGVYTNQVTYKAPCHSPVLPCYNRKYIQNDSCHIQITFGFCW
jgi:hypothetical protein